MFFLFFVLRLKMSVDNPKETKQNRTTAKENDLAPLFPMKRYYDHTTSSRDYYAYGNTLPEDFLESCTDREPSVLSLGCGDIRSCFYTLWKHFDTTISNAPCRYDNVSFTLNDISAAVLARNVIFVYLAINLPNEIKLRENWLCGMWAIWYCHELGHDHVKLLSHSLKYLINFSSSLKNWNSDDNILKPFILFESASCLSGVSKVWKMWFDEGINVHSVKSMQKSRKELMHEKINNLELYCSNFSRITTFVYGKAENQHSLNIQAFEVRSYILSGNSFVESFFDTDLPSQTKVNLTLYDRSDGIYTLHYGLVPFRAYQQTLNLTPEILANTSLNDSDIVVPSKHFRGKPFLANSFQQFILWVQSVSRVLNKESRVVKFLLSNQDALSFCHEWQCTMRNSDNRSELSFKFDVIYTSNLMDHVGPPNLVLSCVPLLKDKALLFTASMMAKEWAQTLEELLKMCFGFDCSLLPVLFGVRCINHEGKGCSSPVMTRPLPPDIANSEPYLPHVRKLQWEKLCGIQPLRISQLPTIQSDNITDALVNLFGSCAYSYLNPGPIVATYNTIETAILMLNYLTDHLDNSDPPAYAFWDFLSSALKSVAYPFLLSLQTHLLLHGIHIHLVTSEDECPLCNQVPVQDVIGLFSITLSIELLPSIRMTPLFYVIFYEGSLPTNSRQLINESLSGKNVHIFDSFDGISTNETLELNFFVPLQLLHRNYKLAVVLASPQRAGMYKMIEIPTLSSGLSTKSYRFFQPYLKQCVAPIQQNKDFGTVISHTCNGYETKTVLSLSKCAVDKIIKKRVSPYQIQLLNDSFSFHLNYNYPTGDEEMEITNSTEEISIRIVSKRIEHSFTKECLHYIVSPDHQLSIPPIKDDYSDVIKHQATMQFTKEESAQKDNEPERDLPPLIRVKLVIQKLFEWSSSCRYIQISNPNQSEFILIAVNNILFDYQLQTPALDLAFCITEKNATAMEWDKMLCSMNYEQDVLNDAQLALLKSTLVYFASRTNGSLHTCTSSTVYAEISSRKIDHCFSRAVLYYLLCDPDKNIPTDSTIFLPPVAGSNCKNCNKFSFTLKKCAQCMNVSYCSKDCQKNNWKVHRQNCRKTTSSTPKNRPIVGFFSPHCSFCGKESKNVKKCTRCRKVQYCDKDCQGKHWNKHKIDCL